MHSHRNCAIGRNPKNFHGGQVSIGMSDLNVTVRPYRPSDSTGLWKLKEGFERGLGEGTGGESKAARYDAKLTETYRDHYLAWVGRCVDEDPQSVQVAVDDDGEIVAAGEPIGYVFVLPSSLSFIWDAAVLNELYLHPDVRGTGIADRLMEAAIETADEQELPLDRIVLDVDQKNERARAFYEKYGFEHWGEMVARDL